MGNQRLIKAMREDPGRLSVDDICKFVLEGFLNRWRSRVINSDASGEAIRTALGRIQPYQSALAALAIESVDFRQTVRANGQIQSVGQIVEACYHEIRGIGFKVGPTATSKLLHVLSPGLFVMWDSPILAHFRGQDTRVGDSNAGYLRYLEMQQRVALDVQRAFRDADLRPKARDGEDVARYLSTRMGYDPPKNLAKYLDEYYWITVTNRTPLPPRWHPCVV